MSETPSHRRAAVAPRDCDVTMYVTKDGLSSAPPPPEAPAPAAAADADDHPANDHPAA